MIRLRAAAYTYPGGIAKVGPLDLEVRAGEKVLLTGPTGSGKSTALRLVAGLLQRHGRGRVEGEILVGGRDPAGLVAAERVGCLGFVGQDPEDAAVCGRVDDEVAFALENGGMEAGEIGRRVGEALRQVGLEGLEERDPRSLSGGQRQRLMIAAALAGGARVLVLDEPLAQLDPLGAEEVLQVLERVAAGGVAILLVEHRLQLAMPWADRTVLMAEGRVVADPVEGVQSLWPWGLQGPGAWELAAGASPPGPVRHPPASSVAVLEVEHLRFGWPGRHLLLDLSLRVTAGERVALMGANGAGKSTLLSLISGRLRPTGGQIRGAFRMAVPQNPDLALLCPTVEEELAFAPEDAGLSPIDIAERVEQSLQSLSLVSLRKRAPQALSRGQRLRTAVAASLSARPTLLLLDEPTAGQDRDQVERMFSGLPAEMAVLFACHDPEVVLRHASRLLVLGDGKILEDGPPEEALRRAVGRGLPIGRYLGI